MFPNNGKKTLSSDDCIPNHHIKREAKKLLRLSFQNNIICLNVVQMQLKQ